MIRDIGTYIHNAGIFPDPKTRLENPAGEKGRFDQTASKLPPDTDEKRPNPSRMVEDRVSLSLEAQQKVRELANRDREVRSHEAAHAAVGGRYAGPPRLNYQEGPDGRRYAVAGEVDIDTSKIPGDPGKTLEKAETVRRAALAPANPSAADLAIAAKATRMAAEARMEIAVEQNEELQKALPQTAPNGSRPGQRGRLLNISA